MEEEREQIRRWLDSLYRDTRSVTQLEAVVRAQAFDLSPEAIDVISNLPPGRYTRRRLCDQLNSAIVARGLSNKLGTHE